MRELFGKPYTGIRIPLSGTVEVSRGILRCIDTVAFQRLKGTRQLGPLFAIFPGANHSRAEHSLGVFHLSLELLRRLGFAAEEAREVALAALLHDVGHPPFSHSLDAIEIPGEKLPAHEKVGAEMVREGPLKACVKALGVSPDRVADLIEGKGGAAAFLHSPLDVDRLDFLRRDSYHCGVPYGLGIDTDRLFASLEWDKREGVFVLGPKGREPLMTLATAHKTMYDAVYLHRVSTALRGMIRKAVQTTMAQGGLRKRELKQLLRTTDLEFAVRLRERAEKLKGQARKRVLRLLSPLTFSRREIVKLAAEVKRCNTETAVLEKNLEEQLGDTVIVEEVRRQGFSLWGLKLQGISSGEILHFNFPPYCLLRIYAFAPKRKKLQEILKEMLIL